MSDDAQELIDLTRELLEAISGRDWETYSRLCDPGLTAFEPEAQGHLVEGLGFHRFYFEQAAAAAPSKTTIASPRVWLLGDAAVVAYVRLVQRSIGQGQSETAAFDETRVWQRRDGRWRHVHFHRSSCG